MNCTVQLQSETGERVNHGFPCCVPAIVHSLSCSGSYPPVYDDCFTFNGFEIIISTAKIA